MGQRGFYGAAVEVDPDSDVTPYLIFSWLKIILSGFRRAHGVLRRFYNLADIRSCHSTVTWEEAAGYFLCLALLPQGLIYLAILTIFTELSRPVIEIFSVLSEQPNLLRFV